KYLFTMRVPYIVEMGRSGGTWVADLLNHKHGHRIIFEPFLPFLGGPDPATWEFVVPYKFLRNRHGQSTLLSAYNEIFFGDYPENSWTDRGVTTVPGAPRIVKDVYGLPFAGLLQREFSDIHVIVMVRDPLAVA